VGDEKQFLDRSCMALRRYGHRVLPAHSPGEAILLCELSDQTIDLLLTDIVMPGMNGKELRDRIAQMRPGLKACSCPVTKQMLRSIAAFCMKGSPSYRSRSRLRGSHEKYGRF
jgi:CheY-like chemotaxis protein